MAYHDGRLMKIYPVSSGFNSVGCKRFEGGKTPESIYRINKCNLPLPCKANHRGTDENLQPAAGLLSALDIAVIGQTAVTLLPMKKLTNFTEAAHITLKSILNPI